MLSSTKQNKCIVVHKQKYAIGQRAASPTRWADCWMHVCMCIVVGKQNQSHEEEPQSCIVSLLEAAPDLLRSAPW